MNNIYILYYYLMFKQSDCGSITPLPRGFSVFKMVSVSAPPPPRGRRGRYSANIQGIGELLRVWNMTKFRAKNPLIQRTKCMPIKMHAIHVIVICFCILQVQTNFIKQIRSGNTLFIIRIDSHEIIPCLFVELFHVYNFFFTLDFLLLHPSYIYVKL